MTYSEHQHISSAPFPVKRTKTYLRNVCGQDRLVNLAKISIDSVVVDLKASGKFYDMVIDHFATMKDRRMAFFK